MIYAAVAIVSFAAGALTGAFAAAWMWGRQLRRARKGSWHGESMDFTRKRVGG